MRIRKGAFLKKRRGSALLLALGIIVIGSALVAAMFELSTAFSRTAGVQHQGYFDHITVADHVERAKGFLVMINNQRELADRPVLHGPGNTSFSADITALAALQLTQNDDGIAGALSVDTGVMRTKNGSQRLIMQVYDANYNPESVTITNLDELSQLPSSLMLGLSRTEESGTVKTGTFISAGSRDPEIQNRLSGVAYEDYGAYLIRVRLFNIDTNGLEQGTPVYELEEAFFQTVRR